MPHSTQESIRTRCDMQDCQTHERIDEVHFNLLQYLWAVSGM